MTSLYARLLAAGCELDHHESDLYVRATSVAAEIIRAYERDGGITNRSTFASAIDGATWYELPFAFMPFWEQRRAKVGTCA